MSAVIAGYALVFFYGSLLALWIHFLGNEGITRVDKDGHQYRHVSVWTAVGCVIAAFVLIEFVRAVWSL